MQLSETRFEEVRTAYDHSLRCREGAPVVRQAPIRRRVVLDGCDAGRSSASTSMPSASQSWLATKSEGPSSPRSSRAT